MKDYRPGNVFVNTKVEPKNRIKSIKKFLHLEKNEATIIDYNDSSYAKSILSKESSSSTLNGDLFVGGSMYLTRTFPDIQEPSRLTSTRIGNAHRDSYKQMKEIENETVYENEIDADIGDTISEDVNNQNKIKRKSISYSRDSCLRLTLSKRPSQIPTLEEYKHRQSCLNKINSQFYQTRKTQSTNQLNMKDKLKTRIRKFFNIKKKPVEHEQYRHQSATIFNDNTLCKQKTIIDSVDSFSPDSFDLENTKITPNIEYLLTMDKSENQKNYNRSISHNYQYLSNNMNEDTLTSMRINSFVKKSDFIEKPNFKSQNSPVFETMRPNDLSSDRGNVHMSNLQAARDTINPKLLNYALHNMSIDSKLPIISESSVFDNHNQLNNDADMDYAELDSCNTAIEPISKQSDLTNIKTTMSLWFMPSISKVQAEMQLRKGRTGNFIIRRSVSIENAYDLAVNTGLYDISSNIKIYHYLILSTKQGLKINSTENDLFYNSLTSLIHDHMFNSGILAVKLILPVMKVIVSSSLNISPDEKKNSIFEAYYVGEINISYIENDVGLKQCSKQIHDKNISKIHCTFQFGNNGLVITDSGRLKFFRIHYYLNRICYIGLINKSTKYKFQSEWLQQSNIFAIIIYINNMKTIKNCILFAEIDKPFNELAESIKEMKLAHNV